MNVRDAAELERIILARIDAVNRQLSMMWRVVSCLPRIDRATWGGGRDVSRKGRVHFRVHHRLCHGRLLEPDLRHGRGTRAGGFRRSRRLKPPWPDAKGEVDRAAYRSHSRGCRFHTRRTTRDSICTKLSDGGLILIPSVDRLKSRRPECPASQIKNRSLPDRISFAAQEGARAWCPDGGLVGLDL